MLQPDNRVAIGFQTPSGTAQRTKPPPLDSRMDPLLFADLDVMGLRWATGAETREKLLRNLGGIVFSLLLVGTLHVLIAMTE
jgi:hypothetical protein